MSICLINKFLVYRKSNSLSFYISVNKAKAPLLHGLTPCSLCARFIYMGGTDPNAVRTITSNTMTKITIGSLTTKARKAASVWNEADAALSEWNEGFGLELDCHRDLLKKEFTKADQQGLDLSCFQGEQSKLVYPDMGTRIVVAIHKAPAGHETIDELTAEIEELESKLKQLKTIRKNRMTEIALREEFTFPTERITIAFKRTK